MTNEKSTELPADNGTQVRTESDRSRRRFLKASTIGVAGVLASSAAQAVTAEVPEVSLKAFHTNHDLKPLSFDSGKLKGLSQRLIESHWSNNYGGSVRALNETNRRLKAAMADSQVPAFTYNGLKREHLMRTGSVVLHELYFDNLGGDGRVGSELRSTIGSSFGDFDGWESEFRRIAAGLGGGSGWVVLAHNRHLGALENYWMADHMHGPVDSTPLLVLDMYEHSYHMDYGAATARYVDAFFENINWDSVAARLEG